MRSAVKHRSGRRELRRHEYAVRGAAILVSLGVLLGLVYLGSTGAVGGDPSVSAVVRDAGGSLREGSDVKIAGVVVGSVSAVGRGVGGGIEVEMSVPEEDLAKLPSNVVARILPATVFGTSYVDLVVHGPPSDDALGAGAVIPADETQDTLELQQALDDIDRLVTALGPAELASALTSGAQALDGRGRKLGAIVDTVDGYLARLNPQLPVLRSNLRKLATNLELVDEVAPDLLDATEDGLVVLGTVVEQEATIRSLIVGGTSLSRTSTRFLDANTRDLVRLIDNGAVLLDSLYDNRVAGITRAIRVNKVLGPALRSTRKKGHVLSDAHLRTDAPRYYTREDRPRFSAAALSGMAMRAER